MLIRSQHDRRTDGSTAERFDLAVLAARAFDLHAGHNYLVLSGVNPTIVHGFVMRYPRATRALADAQERERRHYHGARAH
jgi:hypothetical protein